MYETDLPIVSDLTEFAPACGGCCRWKLRAVARVGGSGARRLPAQPRATAGCPASSTWRRSWRSCGVACLADAVFTCGAGNFTVWAHRFYEFSQYGTQLAPRSGAMGYGVPAALAAKALHPDRIVVCLAGDGDFMMASSELATAIQYDLPVIVLVVDNGMYGTIRMHQERLFPGRVSGTDLANPDFAALRALVRLLR